MNELIKQLFFPVRVLCVLILFVGTFGFVGLTNIDFDKLVNG